jgi:hypothetical protein
LSPSCALLFCDWKSFRKVLFGPQVDSKPPFLKKLIIGTAFERKKSESVSFSLFLFVALGARRYPVTDPVTDMVKASFVDRNKMVGVPSLFQCDSTVSAAILKVFEHGIAFIFGDVLFESRPKNPS